MGSSRSSRRSIIRLGKVHLLLRPAIRQPEREALEVQLVVHRLEAPIRTNIRILDPRASRIDRQTDRQTKPSQALSSPSLPDGRTAGRTSSAASSCCGISLARSLVVSSPLRRSTASLKQCEGVRA